MLRVSILLIMTSCFVSNWVGVFGDYEMIFAEHNNSRIVCDGCNLTEFSGVKFSTCAQVSLKLQYPYVYHFSVHGYIAIQ